MEDLQFQHLKRRSSMGASMRPNAGKTDHVFERIMTQMSARNAAAVERLKSERSERASTASVPQRRAQSAPASRAARMKKHKEENMQKLLPRPAYHRNLLSQCYSSKGAAYESLRRYVRNRRLYDPQFVAQYEKERLLNHTSEELRMRALVKPVTGKKQTGKNNVSSTDMQNAIKQDNVKRY